MRNFIDIIKEAKLIDGVYTAVIPQDLPKLIIKGDLRGIGHDGKIYLWYAYDDTHLAVRYELGLPSEGRDYSEDGGDHGFNFFVAMGSLNKSHQYDGDFESGRDDWVTLGPADFMVNEIGIWVDHPKNYCLSNGQFARMVATNKPYANRADNDHPL